LKFKFSFLIALWVSVVSATAADFPFIGRIQVSNSLNVRAAAKMDAQVLGKIKGGEKVVVLGEEEGFYELQYPKQLQTWIASWLLLEKGKAKKDVIARDQVNVRSGPGMHYPVVARIVQNSEVQVLEVNKDNWARIGAPTEATAWVSKKFVVEEESLVAYQEREQREEHAGQLYKHAVGSFKQHLQTRSMTEDEYQSLKAKFDTVISGSPDSMQASQSREFQVKLAEFRSVLRLEELRKNENIKLREREQQIAAEHQEKLEQLKKKKREPVRKFEFEGWMDDIGGILFRPATHSLKKGNDILFYLKSKDIDMDEYVGKYVGINGSTHNFRMWGTIIDVKAIEVLHDQRSSFWTK
jgi:uncharacterized protein YgiM (DUF1202 family)